MTQSAPTKSNNGAKAGAITKQADDGLGLKPLAAAPTGMERVTAGADLAGYWRQAIGDDIYGKLCGPAPEKMLEKSKGEYGMIVVELCKSADGAHDGRCAITQSQAGFDQLSADDKKLWKQVKDGDKTTYLRAAGPGELVVVSVRVKAKDTFHKPDGTIIWVKVKSSRVIGNGNDMFDYECYEIAPAGQSAGSSERAGAVPFDRS